MGQRIINEQTISDFIKIFCLCQKSYLKFNFTILVDPTVVERTKTFTAIISYIPFLNNKWSKNLHLFRTDIYSNEMEYI